MDDKLEEENGNKREETTVLGPSSKATIVHWKLMIPLIFNFYFLSCGIERIYQPMVRKN